jgi:hypothetical protein
LRKQVVGRLSVQWSCWRIFDQMDISLPELIRWSHPEVLCYCNPMRNAYCLSLDDGKYEDRGGSSQWENK